MNAHLIRLPALILSLAAAGCQLIPERAPEPEPPPPPPVIHEPVATHEFQIDEHTDVVGMLQVAKVEGEDTLLDIARRFNVGYEEIVRANPGVDPWLPGVGREIYVPTQFVLPNAPREGIVINLAQLRAFYFPKAKKGEPQTVITHPIGIGKVGWETPVGTTKVRAKAKNPTWFPPASVRKEHLEDGEKLPAKVPPGPDNPLGTHVMTLGWPSYLIHGTNKPYGVGLRSSHGCIRFYPEDIVGLYERVPVGTKVTVVNQPFVFGWRDGQLYVQAFPILEDDEREHPKGAEALLNAAISDEMWQRIRENGVTIDLALVDALIAEPRGIAVPVSKPQLTLDSYLAAARRVENRVPDGATWDGSDEMVYTAEEWEARLRKNALKSAKADETGQAPAKKQKVAAPASAKKSAGQAVSAGAPVGSR
jgi:L,D-transpeptidase ErfK/SrfK